MSEAKPCYLFDIDGTLADLGHRLHHIKPAFDEQGNLPRKDWDAFFAACPGDTPIEHVCELARTLVDADKTVVLVSGRSDQCRPQTEVWLEQHGLDGLPLYMRKAGDHRPDYLVKAELLDRVRADGFEPIMAFDDRSQVVQMWRAKGIPCAQVAEGDF